MHTFETPAPITAELHVPAGRIQIIASDRSDTIVEVQPADSSKNRDVKAARETVVELTGGMVRVTTPIRHQALGPSGAVAVSLRLPAGSRVAANAAAAPAERQLRISSVPM